MLFAEQILKAAPCKTETVWPLFWQTIKVRYVGHEPKSNRLLLMDTLVLADQRRLTFISSVQTLDITKRTCQVWLLIGTDAEIKSVGHDVAYTYNWFHFKQNTRLLAWAIECADCTFTEEYDPSNGATCWPWVATCKVLGLNHGGWAVIDPMIELSMTCNSPL